MEFLSKQFNQSQGIANLVLQSPESVRNGFDAAGTHGYKIQHLPFRPDEQFHEYRFDWSSDRIVFYIDGDLTYEMTEFLPTSGGHMFMNHWSNGDPLWSAGPPAQDAVMTVSYVKAYFNSTSNDRQQVYNKRCPKFDPSKVCLIPEQTVPPAGSNAKTYFFSQDGGERTPGQTTYGTTNAGADLFSSFSIRISILVTLISAVL